MPQVFRIGSYWVYFWSIEARSMEVIQKWSDYFGEVRYFC